MSNPASAPVVAYLKKQLSQNPWEESAEIVSLRSRALRLNQQLAESDESDQLEQRRELRDELAKLRAAAFTRDAQQLTQRLDAMPLDDFPDLKAAGDRLRVILRSRSMLPALTQSPDFDPDFLDWFKQVLISPAREAALMKERALVSFRKKKLRKRGQKMIALLQREMPEVCELEKDWLHSLSRHSKSGFSGLHRGKSSWAVIPSNSRAWVIGLVIVVSALLRNIDKLSDDKPARSLGSTPRVSLPIPDTPPTPPVRPNTPDLSPTIPRRDPLDPSNPFQPRDEIRDPFGERRSSFPNDLDSRRGRFGRPVVAPEPARPSGLRRPRRSAFGSSPFDKPTGRDDGFDPARESRKLAEDLRSPELRNNPEARRKRREEFHQRMRERMGRGAGQPSGFGWQAADTHNNEQRTYRRGIPAMDYTGGDSRPEKVWLDFHIQVFPSQQTQRDEEEPEVVQDIEQVISDVTDKLNSRELAAKPQQRKQLIEQARKQIEALLDAAKFGKLLPSPEPHEPASRPSWVPERPSRRRARP